MININFPDQSLQIFFCLIKPSAVDLYFVKLESLLLFVKLNKDISYKYKLLKKKKKLWPKINLNL